MSISSLNFLQEIFLLPFNFLLIFPSYELFCDKRMVSINLWRQSPGSSYTIVWLFDNSSHRLNPQKSSSVFVLLHIWKVRGVGDLCFSGFYVAINSFSTLLLIHLDRGDSDAHFEKKTGPIRWSIADDVIKILREPFILTHLLNLYIYCE